MTITEKLWEWLVEKTPDEEGGRNWACIILWIWGWSIFPFLWVRHRGVCLLLGCDIQNYSSDYLPEDCTEWECKRCYAEGINSQGREHIAYGVGNWITYHWRKYKTLVVCRVLGHNFVQGTPKWNIPEHCSRCWEIPKPQTGAKS